MKLSKKNNLIMDNKLAVIAILAFLFGLIFANLEDYKDFIPDLLNGVKVTVVITVASSLFAIALAFLAGLTKLYAPWPFRWLAIIYIEIFRGTSMLVQLFWLFFVLPFFGVQLDAMTVGILGIFLNIGAYGAEIIRGAVKSIPKGQWEVSVALNFSFLQTLVYIVVPQAFIRMIPPWGNLLIELLKATALVSLITISDLSFKAAQLNSLTYETTKIYTLTLLLYLMLAMVITIGMRSLEKYFSRYK